MRKNLKTAKKMLSILALSSMLLTTVLPQSAIFAESATNAIQQSESTSTGTFDAEEVTRILAGLTTEQKANINKLTGADIAQKNHVDPKDLRALGNINVIVQFKTDPAKIQIIKQALANGEAGVNSQTFATDYTAAQQMVSDSHAKFNSFVNAKPSTQIVGGKSVNSDMRITREYSEAFNGVALSLPANQVDQLTNSPEVASIWSVVEYVVPEQGSAASAESIIGSVGKPTSALTLMGIDTLQAEGHTGIIKSGARQGQAVKVGVLDTGIDYNHPDLFKVTHDANGVRYGGHDLVNSTFDASGKVTYVDDFDPMETIYPDWQAAKQNPNPLEGPPSANYKDYITEHGTHVAGTIAANTTNNNAVYSANGVAPNVELHGYRVLGPAGRGTSESVLTGIDQAAKDHMDVINLSLGANVNDPTYPTSIAINNATLVGVVCVLAAGNAGPGRATVGSPGTSALAITVGASTIPESIPVMTIKVGSSSFQARLFGKSFTQEDEVYKGRTLPIVNVGAGTMADYSGIEIPGKIALVKRGGEFMQTKMANAYAAGAAGMIIYDNLDDADSQGYIPNFLGLSMNHVYSLNLTQAQGIKLSQEIAADPKNATVTFPAALDAPILKNADELAGFSSTGPVKDWTIKPDVVAPGVDILSTAPFDVYEPENTDYSYQYMQMSGTSMATPHVAGIAALVLAAHPDYSPADVKTALMNTAKDINKDSLTYSVYQVGAGRVDPARAIKSNMKIQVLDKTYTRENPMENPTNSNTRQVDNITGSIFFGFKGRGEGATNGSDDVVSSKDFNVINQGTSTKTFNVSTKFISTKFAHSNLVGPGTGNDVKVDFSVNGAQTTSISVGNGSTVKATAKITVPSNALDGTYEGYINLVNATDPTESYRIPFTTTVAVKGINDFDILIKAFTLPYGTTGNWNPDTNGPGGTLFKFSVNNSMESLYILLKDKSGKYLGVAQNVTAIDAAGPGALFGPLPVLQGGVYLPFTSPYTGSLDQSKLSEQVSVVTEGAYSLEMIATDSSGKQYKKESNIYVDFTAPTINMDSDSKPGIYEVDPTGYQPGQEIQRFWGTVYDSNIDFMRNNGETSVPSLVELNKQVPLDQALNTVWGYQDSIFPTSIFDTEAKGRFHFGVSQEDITSEGTDFWIYPSDYAGAADMDTTKQRYHFIKKGSPYVTYTSSGGIDAGSANQDKTVVDANKPFKVNFALKHALGMTGGKITLNSFLYTFANAKLTQEYKDYLTSKGINATSNILSMGEPLRDDIHAGFSTDITISGIADAGALDEAHKDMNIIEVDVTYTHPDPLSGPWEFNVYNSELTFVGKTKPVPVPEFETNVPYIRQATSLITGGFFAEAFRENSLSGAFTGISKGSGAKVTFSSQDGNTATTDNPSSPNNTIEYAGKNLGTYAITVGVSDKPYAVEQYMPGHFKGYLQSPVVGTNRFGYITGGYKDIASNQTPLLLGGDVNGDNVIDIKDALAEVKAYNQYSVLTTPADRTAFLNNISNRNYDIRVGTTGVSAAGIDYYDFYYIFKNFGKINETAPNKAALTALDKLTAGDLTVPVLVNGVALKVGDGIKEIKAALNFKGPAFTVQNATINDLAKGAPVILTSSNEILKDDEVWRNTITEINLDGINVKDALYSGTTDKLATILAGNALYDPIKGVSYNNTKIILHNSLFPAAKKYTVVIKAPGYQDVTVAINVTTSAIAVPLVPIVLDPTLAHLGNDLTLTFPEDADWRMGINRIVVKTANWLTGVTLNVDSNSQYYNISQPGKITFDKALFKAAVVGATQAIVPGGNVFNPQLYTFEIYSTGYTSKIDFPAAVVSKQPVGYGLTFDTSGGTPIPPIAVGYNPANTQMTSNGVVAAISNIHPKASKPGHNFTTWYSDPARTIVFQGGILTGDITLYAGYNVSYIQNYAPVDKNKPNGAKFEGAGAATVLGEGPLILTMPDPTVTPWISSISSIKAEFYLEGPPGTSLLTNSYILDPSTYSIDSTAGTLTFTTATETYAAEHPNEKFAFSKSANTGSPSPFRGYKLTLTTNEGNVIIPDVRLMYRMHYDLNGGTLRNAASTAFNDRLVSAKETAPVLSNTPVPVINGESSLDTSDYYYDKAGKLASNVLNASAKYAKDNTTFYLNWGKTAPTVINDTTDNLVGSDISLTYTDDVNWSSVITSVYIGSKKLVNTVDYTITPGSIKLDKKLFTQAQKININIKATGYVDVNVLNQVIGHKVTFDSSGGEFIAPQIVDSRVAKPSDPSRIDYKFAGWYTTSDLTTPFNFASIITGPTTLYAKYALATSLVEEDTQDNALGNDITLEFSDSDWAHAITEIKVAGNTVSETTYYKKDFALGTITFDKSLFTKVGDFNITISATDYADVTVMQYIGNGYNVHFVLDSAAPFAVQDKIVARRITQPVVTGYDMTWFADEARTQPWDFTNSIYSDKTLYGNWSIAKFTVIIDRQDGSIVENVYADYNTTITAPTAPTRTGYTFGGWYKDAEGTNAWNFASDVVTANTIVYAKWTENPVDTGGGPIIGGGPITGGGPGTNEDEVVFTLDQAAKAIADAVAAGASEVSIIIPDSDSELGNKVTLPTEVTQALANAQKDLKISSTKVEVSIPSQSLQNASEDVIFTIHFVTEDKKQQVAENASQQAGGIGEATIIGQPVEIDTNLQNKPVTLTLPLGNLTADQVKDLAIYIEHSDGTKELVQGKLVKFDDNGQWGLQFTTNKFSTFSAVQIAGVDKYFGVKTKAYVHGYPDGTFNPSGKITRAEVATILAQISTKTASGTAMTFTDVATDYWAMNAITTVTQMGLMNGYGDNTFRGDQEITRAELTSIIARLLGSSDTAAASKFSDIAGHWAKAAIDQVAAAGMINGYEDGTFKPSNSLTRAEAVTMINHYLGRELSTSVTGPTWSDVPATHWAYKEIESASHDQK